MPGILFIHGGDAFARHVFAQEARGEWSQALRIVLEKHGFLDITEAGPEALSDEALIAASDAVLVGRLAPETWTHEVVDALLRQPTSTLIEGPAPKVVEDALGVTRLEAIEEDGAIAPVDDGVAAAAGYYGVRPGAPVTRPRSSTVERPEHLHWQALEGVPITDSQAEAWRARGWDAVRWRCGDSATALCDWVPARETSSRAPAIVRRGSLIGCAFGLFAFLGQRHTCEPYGPDEWRTADRSIGLEVILLGLIDLMHRRRGATRVRVAPWPRDGEWAFTVRHDVSTPLSDRRLDRTLGAHSDADTAATWYLAPSTTAASANIGRVARAPRQELALAAERLWASASERGALERDVPGARIVGAGSRASSHCFRFQGAPNVLWAECNGFDYTEMFGRRHMHPHRFPALREDGTIATLDVLCLPAFESLGFNKPDKKRLASVVGQWRRARGYLQLLQDPGGKARNVAKAARAIREDGSPLMWRTDEVADWWRRTHTTPLLQLRSLGSGRFSIDSRDGARDLVLEFLHADGSRSTRVVDVGQEEMVVEEPGVVGKGPITWDDAHPVFEELLRDCASGSGHDPDDPATRQWILANSVQVPPRAELLLDLLRGFGGPADLSQAAILDVGCGFGGLAAYIAWKERPRCVLGLDSSADFLSVASAASSRLELTDRLRFVNGDMSAIWAIDDRSMDVALANGALMYLLNARDLRRTVDELARVLKPGGHLLVYHRNRWAWRDPHSGTPLIHLFPSPVARMLWKATGHAPAARKRWIGPTELRRHLRRAGLTDIKLVGFSAKARHDAGLSRLWDRSYAMSAVRGPERSDPPTPPRRLAPASHPCDWKLISPHYANSIRDYFMHHSITATDEQKQVTIDTNTQLVPVRGDNLVRYVNELGGLDLPQRSVLEVGCGFGALSLYLALRSHTARYVGIDVDPAVLDVARRVAESVAADLPVEFSLCDMTDLAGHEAGAYDLVIANNSFLYLTTKDSVRKALQEFHRVLSPGGRVVIYQANRWRLREPFTKAPLIHLLPGWLARPVSRVTGWEHNHGRVKLYSPPRLRRELERMGFRHLATRGLRGKPSDRGLRRNLGTYFVLASRRD